MPRKREEKRESGHAVLASIRPRLLCRGNPDPTGKRVPARSRFNSAAAVMPRKPLGRGQAAQQPEASIRPRLLCRGNQALAKEGISQDVGFNSAAAVMPRKRPSRRLRGNCDEKLQFGRGCYAAETRSGSLRNWCRASLQFGRGCYAAETLETQIALAIACVASIRPRLLCRGNRPPHRTAIPADGASIRPRLLCRGNAKNWPQLAKSAELQFGRGCYAAETPQGIGWPSISEPGFNSAAAVMPRKRKRRTIAFLRGSSLQFGRGCYAAETTKAMDSIPTPRRLQFGRGCYAAETIATASSSTKIRLSLQFGRGCYAAETLGDARRDGRHVDASIRPRLLCRGNVRDCAFAFVNVAELQFGRGCYAAETGARRRRLLHLKRASIRPRLLCRGNDSGRSRPRREYCRFNSAAAVMPRKHDPEPRVESLGQTIK